MKLDDRIDVYTALSYKNSVNTVVYDWGNPITVATVPAYVGFESTTLKFDTGSWIVSKQLRCIIEQMPFTLDTVRHRIRWRNTGYIIDGTPMFRRRHGKDFYLSLMLK